MYGADRAHSQASIAPWRLVLGHSEGSNVPSTGPPAQCCREGRRHGDKIAAGVSHSDIVSAADGLLIVDVFSCNLYQFILLKLKHRKHSSRCLSVALAIPWPARNPFTSWNFSVVAMTHGWVPERWRGNANVCTFLAMISTDHWDESLHSSYEQLQLRPFLLLRWRYGKMSNRQWFHHHSGQPLHKQSWFWNEATIWGQWNWMLSGSSVGDPRSIGTIDWV